MSSAAWFRATRERLGLSQDDVAYGFGVDGRSVRRWESGAYNIPDAAVEWLEDRLDQQAAVVATALDAVGDRESVQLTYYRTQGQYDERGQDDGPFGMANANARIIAELLERDGRTIGWAYPDDEDSVYHGE